MAWGPAKGEAGKKASVAAAKTDSKDEVLVSEQLLIVKATTDEAALAAIAKADKRPGVAIAVSARREELAEIRRVAADAAVAAIAAGGAPAVKRPEGLEAHHLARRRAELNPPKGKSGKSCARCRKRISITQSFSTVNCKHVRPNQLTTVAVTTAEECPEYEEGE